MSLGFPVGKWESGKCFIFELLGFFSESVSLVQIFECFLVIFFGFCLNCWSPLFIWEKKFKWINEHFSGFIMYKDSHYILCICEFVAFEILKISTGNVNRGHVYSQ